MISSPEQHHDQNGNVKQAASGDSLHQQAFENSLQPNIISIVSTDIIASVNEAACQLLGYSKDEISGLSLQSIFVSTERRFKKMLKERNTNGRSAASVSVIQKNGNIIPCDITVAVFVDEDMEKCIITILDMSQNFIKQKKRDARIGKLVAADVLLAKSTQKIIDKKKAKVVADNIVLAQKKSDTRFAEHTEWIKYIGKASYDVMWDWDVVSGEIYVGDSIEEMFGYRVTDNTVYYRDFLGCLSPEEKDIVEKKLTAALDSGDKNWNDTFMFHRFDGSLASTTSRASIVRDESGKAIRLIGAIHDVSRLEELELKLSEQTDADEEDRKKFLLTTRFLFDAMWDWKLNTNIIFLGDGFESLFGYSNTSIQGNITSWGNWIQPEDEETVKRGLNEAIQSSSNTWQHSYRLVRADGSVTKVFDRANIFRHPDGKAYRLIGVMKDLSRQKEQVSSGADFVTKRKGSLIEKIKSIIIELVHYTDKQLQINFSDYLSNKLQYDYTYLASIFSEVEGITIQQFIIEQKIERVKELIISDSFSLTEIASKLHYSSVAHLSNQFKKITGFTPSQFKSQSHS